MRMKLRWEIKLHMLPSLQCSCQSDPRKALIFDASCLSWSPSATCVEGILLSFSWYTKSLFYSSLSYFLKRTFLKAYHGHWILQTAYWGVTFAAWAEGSLFSKSERINSKDLMTTYSNRGFFNHAYHDSETLEIDRRFVIKKKIKCKLVFLNFAAIHSISPFYICAYLCTRHFVWVPCVL